MKFDVEGGYGLIELSSHHAISQSKETKIASLGPLPIMYLAGVNAIKLIGLFSVLCTSGQLLLKTIWVFSKQNACPILFSSVFIHQALP
jgi:hypothetical protein